MPDKLKPIITSEAPRVFLFPGSLSEDEAGNDLILRTLGLTDVTLPLSGTILADEVDATAYGAVADDATDATAAINAAITSAGPHDSVYLPAGTYRANGQIEMTTTRIRGAGSLNATGFYGLGTPGGGLNTVIHVTNGAAQTNSLFHAGLGCEISDLAIRYDQPDVATYGTFTQYKPAIFFDTSLNAFDLGGGKIRRVQIERAWDGIKLIGNCLQTIIEDVWMSAFNKGIEIDGSLDTNRIARLHFWPFGCTANQLTAMLLPGHSTGLYIGRSDDLKISDSLIGCGTGADFHTSVNSPGTAVLASLSNVTFDNGSPIFISAGTLLFSNCLFAHGAQSAIAQTGGASQFANCNFNAAGTAGSIQLSGAASVMRLMGCNLAATNADVEMILQSAGVLQIGNCAFGPAANTTYTKPRLFITGGRAIIIGNYVSDKGTGRGDFVKFTTDGSHVIGGNVASGWTYNYPAGHTVMQIFNNI